MTGVGGSASGLADVSRETQERLDLYAALLRKWTPRINLVAPNTLPDLWTRHIVDSAQIARYSQETDRTWADLGSGGGLPGIVIAILRDDITMTLVESDARKAAFLRTVLRETGTSARVLNQRIETVPPLSADVVSARALAPLSRLLYHAERHLAANGRALFPKGIRYREEREAALETWQFRCEEHPSSTQSGAVILEISELARV